MALDGDQLLGIFLRGALGRSGRKRARRASTFLGGQGGFLTASTVMAAVGVAWGIYDSLNAGQPAAAAPTPVRARRRRWCCHRMSPASCAWPFRPRGPTATLAEAERVAILRHAHRGRHRRACRRRAGRRRGRCRRLSPASPPTPTAVTSTCWRSRSSGPTKRCRAPNGSTWHSSPTPSDSTRRPPRRSSSRPSPPSTTRPHLRLRPH